MSKFDLIWPRLIIPEGDAERQNQALDADIHAIQQAKWKKKPGLALAEAHRIADREEDRRQGADSKASSYLLVIAALIPLLTYLESTVWEQKFGTAPRWLSLLILGVAVSYILAAGYWAFKTLKVGRFHTLGANDLITAWTAADPENLLVNEILSNYRKNSARVNKKITCIKMAQEFLQKAIFAFGLLIIVQAGWYMAVSVLPIATNWAVSIRSGLATAKPPTATVPPTASRPVQRTAPGSEGQAPP